jgi:hypothetical protein
MIKKADITLIVLVILISLAFWIVERAFGAEECLTRSQASSRYPGQWLYWHTAKRCWNNKQGRDKIIAKPRRPEPALGPKAATEQQYKIWPTPPRPRFIPWEERIDPI